MYLRSDAAAYWGSRASLWTLGDVLRAYAEKYRDASDLALELPTGTGKTLPALLIGEWVRRQGEGPVVYATPTKQLAHQVFSTAQIEGVPARLLVGSHHGWSAADESDVDGGEAIAITTCSVQSSTPARSCPCHA